MPIVFHRIALFLTLAICIYNNSSGQSDTNTVNTPTPDTIYLPSDTIVRTKTITIFYGGPPKRYFCSHSYISYNIQSTKNQTDFYNIYSQNYGAGYSMQYCRGRYIYEGGIAYSFHKTDYSSKYISTSKQSSYLNYNLTSQNKITLTNGTVEVVDVIQADSTISKQTIYKSNLFDQEITHHSVSIPLSFGYMLKDGILVIESIVGLTPTISFSENLKNPTGDIETKPLNIKLLSLKANINLCAKYVVSKEKMFTLSFGYGNYLFSNLDSYPSFSINEFGVKVSYVKIFIYKQKERY